MTQYQVSRRLWEAYIKAVVPLKAVKGFRKSGIELLNENIFLEDFAAAEVAEIPLRPTAMESIVNAIRSPPTDSSAFLHCKFDRGAVIEFIIFRQP